MIPHFPGLLCLRSIALHTSIFPYRLSTYNKKTRNNSNLGCLHTEFGGQQPDCEDDGAEGRLDQILTVGPYSDPELFYVMSLEFLCFPGFQSDITLTGFKWMGNLADDLRQKVSVLDLFMWNCL